MRSEVPFLLLLTAAVLAVTCFSPADAFADDPPLPQDIYPDYDYIITPGEEGVDITYKAMSEGQAVWRVDSVPRYSDVQLASWTSMAGDIRVVMDGAELDDLVLIHVDDARPTQKFVSVEFDMVSGYLGSLTVADADRTEERKLGTDYNDMFNPVVNAVVKLRSGHMTCFNPTYQMIFIDNLDVTVDTGMTVDRFLTSGENGRYSNLDMKLHGGNIGYMAHHKSRIGNLTYELDHGCVEYFALGSDTEFGGNYSLERANTAFVTGDVDIYVDPTTDIREAIVGGGVFEFPNMLWNGEALQDSLVRNLAIEANGHTFRGDTCFLTEKRDKANQFVDYVFGGVPMTSPISSNAWLEEGGQVSVYGEDGIWNGYSKLTINTGTSIFMNTTLTVPSEGSVNVAMGGKLVSTYVTVVYGNLNVIGELVNNFFIELREDGRIEGKVTGTGLIADQIPTQSHDSTINIISAYDTVLITQDSQQMIREITAMLMSGQYNVRISLPYEGMALINDAFLISLRSIPVSESFHSGYDLLIGGIDSNTLTACDIDITVPVTVPYGKVAVVYYYDESTGTYHKVESEAIDYTHLTFDANAVGVYSITFEDSFVPPPYEPEEKDDTAAVIVLLAGIAVVSAVMVYTIFRFRR